MPPLKQTILDDEFSERLCNVYKFLYGGAIAIDCLNRFAKQARRVVVGCDLFNSAHSSRENSTVVIASWPSSDMDMPQCGDMPFSVGQIKYFVQHSLNPSDQNRQTHIFAVVSWFKHHQHRHWFGSSALVCSNETEAPSDFSIIPIQRIKSVCIHGSLDLSFCPEELSENVLVVIPINPHLCY